MLHNEVAENNSVLMSQVITVASASASDTSHLSIAMETQSLSPRQLMKPAARDFSV